MSSSTNKHKRNWLKGITTVTGIVKEVDLSCQSVGIITITVHPQIGEPIKWDVFNITDKAATPLLGMRVAVKGLAFFRPDVDNPGIQRPYRILSHYEDIEIYNPDDDEENWHQIKKMRGAFPGLTGGKDTVEYLRKIRGKNGVIT